MNFGDFDLATLLPFIAVGFAAQLVDGALGMAFGVISNTLLVGVLGVPPALASQRVHVVECFTTGVSGLSHLFHRNIDGRLFLRLVVPGMIGGFAGAYLLSNLEAGVVKPFVLIYLTAIGLYILWRGIMYPPQIKVARFVSPLGLIGGFLDAAGGGGWGPVVTSNLLVQGGSPRKVIGTVNTAEFFLTVTISVTFLLSLGWETFTVAALGLLIGGVLAAPFGAYVAKRINADLLLTFVGIVLTATSLFGLYRALI